MTADCKAAAPPRAFRESFGFAVAAVGLYVATWQQALHGTDWRWFVLWVDEPGAVHPQHPGYLAVAKTLRWLLSPLGLDAYTVLALLSVIGGAIAVVGLHRAFLALRTDRRFALLATILVLFSPALWHHATVVELHAAFFGVMAWGLWAAVRWGREGGFGWAVATGVLTGAATLMHATGHLAVLLIGAAIAWHGHRRGFRWLVGTSAVFAGAHAAVWSGLFVVLRVMGNLPSAVAGFAERPGDLAAPDNPLDYLLRWFGDMDLVPQFLPTALNEWLLPYAPVSVLLLLALFLRGRRGAAAVAFAVLLLYLFATVALVHAYTDERGAYLLPMLLPATAIAFTVIPRQHWSLLVVVGLACGGVFRGEPGREPPDLEFGQAARAMDGAKPTVFFVADFPEMDGAFRADPNMDLLLARKEYDELLAAQAKIGEFDPTADQIVGWLMLQTAQAKEKRARLVITDRAVSWLSARVPAFEAGFATFVERIGAERLSERQTGIAGTVIY